MNDQSRASNPVVEALVLFCRENGRVCPLPMPWNRLWELLPERERVDGGGWKPALPLILGAWAHTSSAAKAQRLLEHIEWADAHGVLEAADRFLRDLPESDWLHIGEWPARAIVSHRERFAPVRGKAAQLRR